MLPTNDSGIVAVRFPQQEWMRDLAARIVTDRVETGEWLARLDTIKIRKGLNKDEDNFVQAAVNVFMQKIDAKLKNHVQAEINRIKDVEKAVKEIITLELSLTEKKKQELEEKVILKADGIAYDFKIYASDLKDLDEWKRLNSHHSTALLDVFSDYMDKYVLRIGERVAQELQTAVSLYAPLSELKLEWSPCRTEPLGELRQYRKKRNLLGMGPRGSEGDFIKIVLRSLEAYDDDSLFNYSSYCHEGSSLRQRTVKISGSVKIKPSRLTSILDSVTVTKGSGKQQKFMGLFSL